MFYVMAPIFDMVIGPPNLILKGVGVSPYVSSDILNLPDAFFLQFRGLYIASDSERFISKDILAFSRFKNQNGTRWSAGGTCLARGEVVPIIYHSDRTAKLLGQETNLVQDVGRKNPTRLTVEHESPV